MAGRRKTIWWTAVVLLPGSILLGARQWLAPPTTHPTQPPATIQLPKSDGMIRLPGGSFVMGSAEEFEHNTRPSHVVRLKPFWLDIKPVTNRQFEQFVEQTQYETDAERRGSSHLFDRNLATWRETVGVNWRRPEGPDSSLVGKEHYPVVHVTWQDAAAYAAWAEKRLPTEAEFEYAARGGLSDCLYPWGRELILGVDSQHNNIYLANGWQGHFPDEDLAQDGFRGLSPVGHFPPNRFGLHDMAGNVWNWCADWYAAEYYGASLPDQPTGPKRGNERVRRGGSWLSSPNYAGDLRVAYRDHAPPYESTNHTGFRCARDIKSR